jgi:uncharacterized protein YggU (UPF0235/DUF167 family)
MPCEFDVHVLEKRAHVHWGLDKNDQLQCHLTHEPTSDAANRELLKLIAEAVGTSNSKVTLVHGVQDHVKRIKISDHDVALEDVYQALGMIKK